MKPKAVLGDRLWGHTPRLPGQFTASIHSPAAFEKWQWRASLVQEPKQSSSGLQKFRLYLRGKWKLFENLLRTHRQADHH